MLVIFVTFITAFTSSAVRRPMLSLVPLMVTSTVRSLTSVITSPRWDCSVSSPVNTTSTPLRSRDMTSSCVPVM